MKKKVAIIGAGIGGLAAGIRLRHAGYPVQIFEKNSQPGGKTSGQVIEGYSIETGPTILRAPYLLKELLSSVGKDPDILNLQPVDPHYKFFLPNQQTLTISAEINATIHSLNNISPQDAESYTNFLNKTREHYHDAFIKYPQTPFKPRRQTTTINPFSGRTLFQFISSHFSNRWIQGAFAFYPLFFGQNPMFAPEKISMLHALENQWGIVSPQNGMSDLANTLAELFIELGGKISYNDEIRSINSKNNKIHALRVSSGRLEQCDLAISNLSAYQIKTQIDSKKTTPALPNRNIGCSFFTINLIVEHHQSHQTIETHNIFQPDDFQNTMNQIFRKKELPTTPWVYLYHSKNSKHASEADNFFLIVPVPNQSAKIDWEKITLAFRNTILQTLEKHLPGLRRRILHEIISTPQDFTNLYSLPFGTNFQPSVRTSYQNLFFVGENAWQGLGLIGSLTAAEEISNLIQNNQ